MLRYLFFIFPSLCGFIDGIDENLLTGRLKIQKRKLGVKGIVKRCQTNLEMSGFHG
jgi:hypothetical protein